MNAYKRYCLFAGVAVFVSGFWAPACGGQVTGWGGNFCGEATGVPSAGFASGTVTVFSRALTNVVSVCAGESHGLALSRDGRVFGWGWNADGQAIGTPGKEIQNAAGLVAIGGSVLTNVAAISAGAQYSLALLRDGTVVGWGTNYYNAEKVPADLTNITAISAGWTHSLALKSDGTIVGWGIPKTPEGLTNIAAIAAGRGTYGNNLALKTNGTIVQWTAAGNVEPPPAGLSNVVAIASGAGHCLALKRDGRVLGWGDNNIGQATGIHTTTNLIVQTALPVIIGGVALTNVVEIAAGRDFSLARTSDGTIVAWGYLYRQPVKIPPGMTNVIAIATGDDFCLAVQGAKQT